MEYVDGSEEQTLFLSWYGFALHAAGEAIKGASDPSDLIQVFVDERFSQFDSIYARADEMTQDITEFYPKNPELLKKLGGNGSSGFNEKESSILARQYVLKYFYRLINSIKSRISEDQNEELVEDSSYDDMTPVRQFFNTRVGDSNVIVEELGFFVDDIIEQIKSITANPHNLNADDILTLLTSNTDIFYRSFKK